MVEVCGVGYEIWIGKPPNDPLGSVVTFYTHFVVREHEQLLYGFPTRAERDMFRRLITVNGIGPKVALSLLTHLTPQQMVLAVVEEDSGRLKGVPGIGPKTARRLILELKDKLKDLFPAYEAGEAADRSKAYEEEKGDMHSDMLAQPVHWAQHVEEALLALGFRQEEAREALQYIKTVYTAADKESDLALEIYLKEALKYLSRPSL